MRLAIMLVILAACGGHGGPAGPDGAPGADGAQACSTPIADDPHLADRLACKFAAGAMPADTLALPPSIPIQHVIVVMKENRSFDYLFGALGAMQPDAETFPAGFTNPDPHGAPVAPFHAHTTCEPDDPGHQWQAMHDQIDGGKMDGYVNVAADYIGNDGWFALSYLDQTDLPFYYWLASTFTVADHYYPSVRSGTFPNRDYMLLGTSGAVMSTGTTVWPDPSLTIIFQELDAAGVTWSTYADAGDEPFEGCLDDPNHVWEGQRGFKQTSDLLGELASGTLPQVAFIDAREGVADEHPPADVQVGEAWTKELYDAWAASPERDSTVILLTWDESGGFFDHVPPPSDACLARPADTQFFELGTRVPLIAISTYARPHHVAHTRKEHASITRFIEAVFGVPALTARDANADALFDMFDFGCAPQTLAAAPAPGAGGCRGPSVTTDKAAYAAGEPITFTFTNGPGNAKDWIGVYPKGTTPGAVSTIFGYVGGGGHTATSGVTDGSITLGPGSENPSKPWPLPSGEWVGWFLVDDGYTSVASVEFTIL